MFTMEWDEELAHKAWREDGLKEGHEEGRKEGMSQGLEKGKVDIARILLRMMMPVEQSVRATGLPEATVRALSVEAQ